MRETAPLVYRAAAVAGVARKVSLEKKTGIQ
jgi:hypothetical protein